MLRLPQGHPEQTPSLLGSRKQDPDQTLSGSPGFSLVHAPRRSGGRHSVCGVRVRGVNDGGR